MIPLGLQDIHVVWRVQISFRACDRYRAIGLRVDVNRLHYYAISRDRNGETKSSREIVQQIRVHRARDQVDALSE